MTVDAIKHLLDKLARPFLVKYLTRFVAYGAAAVSAKLAISAPSGDTQAAVVDWVASGLFAGVALGIDWLHHRADRRAAPADTGQEVVAQ
jgi:hypothetical protein